MQCTTHQTQLLAKPAGFTRQMHLISLKGGHRDVNDKGGKDEDKDKDKDKDKDCKRRRKRKIFLLVSYSME